MSQGVAPGGLLDGSVGADDLVVTFFVAWAGEQIQFGDASVLDRAMDAQVVWCGGQELV